MRSPYDRRGGRRFSWLQFTTLVIGAVVIFFVWQRLSSPPLASAPTLTAPPITPTQPEHLTGADVLPTLTVDPGRPPRSVYFPGALVSARIIDSIRTETTWETRYLGDAVGLLEGTSWLDDPGGNIVLAGHVETALGAPGPFAHLFESVPGDDVVLRDGEREVRFRVTAVERAEPDDMSYVAQDGRRRITMITCSDWNFDEQSYQSRLIVIAEPVEIIQ